MDYFCCCRLVRLSFVFHWPSLSPSPPHLGDKPPLWAVLFRADWIGWPCFAASIVPVWKVSRLSKCVDAVRSLTMSIFLLVRFVTSVTKKKKPFSAVWRMLGLSVPLQALGVGHFFALGERVWLQYVPFLAFETQDASVAKARLLSAWHNPQN